MKDIPLFSTRNGVASLVLSQIPYRQEAYVRLQAVSQLDSLVEECVSFCRACGALRVYGTGSPGLERYPLETAIWTMTGQRSNLPEPSALLWPLLPEHAALWREIYNRRMAQVPHGALLSQREEINRSGCYFVHRNRQLLGIGRVEGDQLLALAAEQPGCGAELVAALATVMSGQTIRLEVASANERAVRLYQRLGFVKTGEIDRWYQIDESF